MRFAKAMRTNDGTDQHKLIVPEGFTPFGFTRDGLALYGSFGEKEIKQLAAARSSHRLKISRS
jgi:hypothetical protein